MGLVRQRKETELAENNFGIKISFMLGKTHPMVEIKVVLKESSAKRRSKLLFPTAVDREVADTQKCPT